MLLTSSLWQWQRVVSGRLASSNMKTTTVNRAIMLISTTVGFFLHRQFQKGFFTHVLAAIWFRFSHVQLYCHIQNGRRFGLKQDKLLFAWGPALQPDNTNSCGELSTGRGNMRHLHSTTTPEINKVIHFFSFKL